MIKTVDLDRSASLLMKRITASIIDLLLIGFAEIFIVIIFDICMERVSHESIIWGFSYVLQFGVILLFCFIGGAGRASIGQRVLGLTVLTSDRKIPSVSHGVLRQFLGIVLFPLFPISTGLIVIRSTRSLADVICFTCTILRPPAHNVVIAGFSVKRLHEIE
jgi:hypothetical protein